MHELPVTQGMLDVVLQAARRNGAQRVRIINLVVGDLAGILDDSVQFYFDLLSRDTPAEGAILHFERVPAEALCGECGRTFRAQAPLAPACPACGSPRLTVRGGREFYVESIEVDNQDTSGPAHPERE